MQFFLQKKWVMRFTLARKTLILLCIDDRKNYLGALTGLGPCRMCPRRSAMISCRNAMAQAVSNATDQPSRKNQPRTIKQK